MKSNESYCLLYCIGWLQLFKLDESLKCENSIESHSTVLHCGAVHQTVEDASNLWMRGWNPKINMVVWGKAIVLNCADLLFNRRLVMSGPTHCGLILTCQCCQMVLMASLNSSRGFPARSRLCHCVMYWKRRWRSSKTPFLSSLIWRTRLSENGKELKMLLCNQFSAISGNGVSSIVRVC